MKILYINDDPVEGLLAEAFKKAKVEAEIMVAKTIEKAREYLSQADDFRVVFMDFDMGRGQTTVSSGLVQDFVNAGFKMIVANSRSSRSNEWLKEAGCTHVCEPNDFEFFVGIYLRK